MTSSSKRFLLLGSTGQVGRELLVRLERIGSVLAPTREELDLTDLGRLAEAVRSSEASTVINAAAFTNVDTAEVEVERAFLLNARVPEIVAKCAAEIGANVVHYSTDYVYDGSKPQPYSETDVPNPVNVYGRSKLQGDWAIQATGVPYVILRTSWVYGPFGRNFFLNVLARLKRGETLRVVADQIGAPTPAAVVAEVTMNIVQSRTGPVPTGIYHLACGGRTSWYGFAADIARLLRSRGFQVPDVQPITSNEFPQKAKRPHNSCLSTAKLANAFHVKVPDWDVALPGVFNKIE